MSSDTPRDVRPAFIQLVNEGLQNGDIENHEITDGYHSIADLYLHRHHLTAGFFNALAELRQYSFKHSGMPWRSKKHDPYGDPMFDGMFIVGVTIGEQLITYHIPIEFWDLFDACNTMEYAPPWDGHDSDDVLRSIKKWVSPF